MAMTVGFQPQTSTPSFYFIKFSFGSGAGCCANSTVLSVRSLTKPKAVDPKVNAQICGREVSSPRPILTREKRPKRKTERTEGSSRERRQERSTGDENEEMCSWVRAVGTRPPLSRHEEILFSNHIQEWVEVKRHWQQLEKATGNAATDADVAQSLGTTAVEIHKIRGRAQRAKSEMLLANSRMVSSVARSLQLPPSSPPDSHLLLCQMGGRILLECSEKFDPFHPSRPSFITFAYKNVWIHLSRALKKQVPVVAIGSLIQAHYSLIQQKHQEFLAKYGVAPSLEELSHLTSLSTKRISVVSSVMRASSFIRSSDDSEEGSNLQSRSLSNPQCLWRTMEKEEVEKMVSASLKSLPDQQLEAIARKFGLENMPCESRRKVAKKMGKSEHMVKKYEAIGMDILRMKLKEWVSYLEC